MGGGERFGVFRDRCERLSASGAPTTAALGLFLLRASFSLAMTEASSAVCPSRAAPPAAMHFKSKTLGGLDVHYKVTAIDFHLTVTLALEN